MSGAEKYPAKAFEVLQGKEFQEFSILMQNMSELEKIPGIKELENDLDVMKTAEILIDL